MAQQAQRIRWVNMPEPDARQLGARLLYVDDSGPGGRPGLKDFFARIENAGEVKRKRGPLVVETYWLLLLQEPRGDVLDHSPPPELR